MRRDLSHALRLFRRSPGFTILALLSIALGTGATAVVFTAVKTVLIEPLPYADTSSLVELRTDFSTGGKPHSNWVFWSDMQDFAQRNRSFESLGTYHYAMFNLAGGSGVLPEALYGVTVSANLFPVLGVTPMLGRNILAEEDQPGRNNVMILSYGLWQRHFHADAGVIGRTVQVNGHASTVIGVMPPGFDFPLRLATTVRPPSPYMEFWAPLGVDPTKAVDRNDFGYGAVARLKKDVSMARAGDDLASISRDLAREFPHADVRSVSPVPLRERTLGFASTGLWLLFGAASMFMLIGCANVANLLLARGLARQREFAIRFALGASRVRVVRQLLTESCLLAILGGLGGYLLTRLAWTVLPAFAPMSIPRLSAARADGWVFGFSVLLALIDGLVFGALPAFRASAVRPAASRKSRNVLVTAEVAVAMTLVITGSLLTASFVRLIRTDLGFDSSHVLASIIVPSGDRYPTPASRAPLWRAILESARRIRGVESAGAVDALPFSGENTGGIVSTAADGPAVVAEVDTVSADYLPTLGVRLLSGRGFREDDVVIPRDVAIVDENAARRLWPQGSAVGQRLCVDCTKDQPPHWKEVVGVVESIHHAALDEPAAAEVYVTANALENAGFLVVRTRRPQGEIAQAIRSAVAGIDPTQPVFLSAGMSTLIGDSIADRRFVFTTFLATGILSLLFAAAGIYGVVSYATSHRRREIGIRMAIGATPRGILALVFRQGMRPVWIGIATGTFGAWAAARLLRGTLPGFATIEPSVVAAAIVIVTLSAAIACVIPARRATGVDPVSALRQE
jgi:putative ABC transport system permease protein